MKRYEPVPVIGTLGLSLQGSTSMLVTYFGKLASLGGSRPPDPPDLAPPAPTGVPKMGGRRPKAAPPLLAPEAPGPGGLGGGSPPGRPAPQKFVTNLCWWSLCNNAQAGELMAALHMMILTTVIKQEWQ